MQGLTRQGPMGSIRQTLLTALACAVLASALASCSFAQLNGDADSSPGKGGGDSPEAPIEDREDETDEQLDGQSSIQAERKQVFSPLSWDASNANLVGRQGTTALWGSCGECCIANSLNLTTGSSYTEADIVAYCLERDLCDPTTGGMTLQNIADAYEGLLAGTDDMAAYGYGGDYAPSIDLMAHRLEQGILLNVAVYGEMMREGGHTGEGDVYSTHWIVLHSVERNEDGSVAGFGVIDSASDITYLTSQGLSDIYYGHDGTTVIDPSCVIVYRWEYAE